MIDPKSQLNLFGKARRGAPDALVAKVPSDPTPPIAPSAPPIAPSAPEPDSLERLESPPPSASKLSPSGSLERLEPPPASASKVLPPDRISPPPVPSDAADEATVATDRAAIAAPDSVGVSVPAPQDEPSSADISEAILPGLRPSAGAQYLFPPSNDRKRVDMHFSRRMSDLIRRLQLLERDAKSGLGLTLPQAHAIHALDAAGSLRMQELAATLGLAQSTVTRLVAPLKRVGLLDRRPDRNDGRATRAYLTDEGKRSVDQLEQTDRDLYGSLFDRIPATRRAEVVAAIELLHEVVLATGRGEE